MEMLLDVSPEEHTTEEAAEKCRGENRGDGLERYERENRRKVRRTIAEDASRPALASMAMNSEGQHTEADWETNSLKLTGKRTVQCER